MGREEGRGEGKQGKDLREHSGEMIKREIGKVGKEGIGEESGVNMGRRGEEREEAVERKDKKGGREGWEDERGE